MDETFLFGYGNEATTTITHTQKERERERERDSQLIIGPSTIELAKCGN